VKVVVTGSTGFVGGAVARALVQRGDKVLGASRSPHSPLDQARGIEPFPELMEFAGRSDGVASDELLARLADVDAVIHAAGDPTFGNGDHYVQANLDTTRRLVEAFTLAGAPLRAFVLTSSIGAQDRPVDADVSAPLDEHSLAAPASDYGRSKLEAERVVLESTLPARVARLGMVVGRRMRPDSHLSALLRMAHGPRAHVLRRAGGTLPLVHVDDVVAALLLMIDRAEEAPALSLVVGANPTISAVVARATGCRSHALRLPARLRRAIPFALRSTFYPELTVGTVALEGIGWSPGHRWEDAVDEVNAAVMRRTAPDQSPEGLTVVSGAASGLGLAVTRRLRGRRLVLVDRDAESLAAIAAEVGAVGVVVGDVRHDLSTRLDELAKANDLPYVEAFLCAGMGAKGPFMSASDRESGIDAIEVNLTARLRMARHLMRYMRAERFGRVVFISSSTALSPMPQFAAYAGSNAGLLTFGEALAHEVRPEGIHVLTVCPSGMDTRFQERAGVRRVDGERLLDPADVADAIMTALGNPAKSVLMVGPLTHAMNLFQRIAPRRVQPMIWNKLVAARR
jgi:nucleoside-diphosphate-sugar epimerase